MQLGIGVLEIPPEDFWNYTFHEFFAKFEAKERMAKANQPEEPMTHQGMRDLMKRLEVEK